MDSEFLKNLNILYVEDNIDSLELTSLMLSEFFNNVITAKDGIEALEKIQTKQNRCSNYRY